MAMTNDKRRIKRRHLIYYLRVFNRQNQEMLGHLVDITAEGLMIVAEKPVELHRIYSLQLTLPAEILGNEHLDLEGEAMWCKKDVDPAFYVAGFQLNGMGEEDLHIIRRLIKDFGFQN